MTENSDLFEKYMDIGNDTFEDAKSLVQLAVEALNQFRDSEFDRKHSGFLSGLLNKMAIIASNFKAEEAKALIVELRDEQNDFISIFSSRTLDLDDKVSQFNEMYKLCMRFNDLILQEKKDNLNFGPVNFDIVDKGIVATKILETISLIQKCDSLTEKCKQKLVGKLNETLTQLYSPQTDWGKYIKDVGYVIMVLGAIGDFSGGLISVKEHIDKAKYKLEEANIEVQKSSYSVSKQSISDIFVLDDTTKIDPSDNFLLKENFEE